MKVTKQVYPSPILEIGETNFYLKAVVKHTGDLGAGHYKTALNLETLWVIANDSFNFQVTNETPFDGYLFFYEQSCLRISKEFSDRLSNLFDEQRSHSLIHNMNNRLTHILMIYN